MKHNKRTHEDYVRLVKQVHGSRLKVVETYIDAKTKIKHKWVETGEVFELYPNNVLRGRLAKGIKQRFSHDDYVKVLKERVGDDVEVCELYINMQTKIKHYHVPSGYVWTVKPQNVLNGKLCPQIRSRFHSRMAILWLKEVGEKLKLKIQHAENGGERWINRYKLDGFNAEYRLVFEFYGDDFHGNPTKHKPKKKCHPWSDKTAQQLYKQTLKREEALRKKGFLVVSIWEHEWKTDFKGWWKRIKPLVSAHLKSF